MGEFWASAHHKVLGLACCHGGSLPVVALVEAPLLHDLVQALAANLLSVVRLIIWMQTGASLMGANPPSQTDKAHARN